MSIETLKNMLPDYAKDIKLNLSSMAADETLSAQQLWGTFMATAMAGRNATVIQAIEAEASQKLSPEALNAAKGSAAIMAMNNVYYKFTGMMPDYRTLPAKLRMNIIANPGIDKMDFEIWSLAVSAVNGCQYCLQAHEKTLREHGVSQEQIQASVRVAATVQAVSAILDGAEALQSQMAKAA